MPKPSPIPKPSSTPKPTSKFKLTRRGFFKASAVTAAAGAAVGVLAGCSHDAGEATSDPVVVDDDSAVNVMAEEGSPYDYQDDYGFTLEGTWSLPLGTVLRPAEGTWIPATIAGSSALPMVKAGAFSSSSGALVEVVSKPKDAAATAVIYDVGCSDSLYAWTELDTTSRAWTLYASRFSEGTLQGETQKLWEGTSDYDPAPFAVTGSKVIWQVQPALSGSKTAEHSICYVWNAGDADATAAVESPGRFATKPTISGDACVLTPRVNADEGTYYGVIAYSISDDLATKLDELVMPQSVKPFRATRVGEKFVVSVEASYGSGGLLSKMGTYIGTRNGDFIKIDREPSECPAGKNNLYVVKSRSSYAVVSADDTVYSTLLCIDRAVDYGEYPARSGECDVFVTFATVKDPETGYPASVTVRAFRLNG